FSPVLLALLALASGRAAPGAGVEGPSVPAADEQALKSAHLSVSGTALLEFFRKRIPAEVPEHTLTALAGQLADPSPATQQRAVSREGGGGGGRAGELGPRGRSGAAPGRQRPRSP